MGFPQFVSAISIFLIYTSPLILGQQPYIRKATTLCDSRDNSTSVLGYTCNGVSRSCQTYLTFRAAPPYDSVSAISTLLGVDQSQLSQLNSLPESTIFESDRTVLVPVTCSCSGLRYQANVSYIIRKDDTVFFIANNTFQGLSTCQAILDQNGDRATTLSIGSRLNVPLRCACPTKGQTDGGVKYLLSYLVTSNQYVFSISQIFGVETGSTLAANGLSVQDTTIYPSTTLLVPVQDPPSSSQVTAPQPPPPPYSGATPASVPPGSGGGGSSKAWVYAVVGVLGGIALATVIGVFVFICCRRRRNKGQPVVSSESFESVEKPLKREKDPDSEEFLESLSGIGQSLKVYSFEELKAATEDFSSSCLIEGSVYRGTVNGDFAAIKKVNGDVSKEINLLNKINHFNLILLSGICFNVGNWYRVYEYAHNGSLSDWIHNNDERRVLSWNQRLQIALDIAAGLNYLHCYASPSHVHKNLNSSNVLISRDFRAKIANFGLARSAEGDGEQFLLTRHIVGTKGYMAPEYLENGLISPKLDVYALGVLMLEILTGSEVSKLYDRYLQLSDVLDPVLDQENGLENLKQLMDPSLQGKYPPELALLIFRLIDNCLKKDPSDRPSTDEILRSLSRISNSSMSGEWAISISEHHTRPR
ncbi:lysM domain receptor-like kinase 4 [Dorcoceras hygrometricum]|uniref:LysM domain receptor-like kinase 4 n=1 Tax=Dorcoceras hygrometricum TaxID=472368 RepID=A0A2Z7D0I2_9LAMI|nr:lysM domain receptor-like kinase 4 [Dorcoceras hygrometricum]